MLPDVLLDVVPDVLPGVLPDGIRNTPYSQTLTASGGPAPYSFSISSGALPSGLTLTNAIDLLVGLGTMMVTELTSAWDTPSHTGGMPSTDTSDLTITSMGLLL